MPTSSLKAAFDMASELPDAEQDRIASELIDRLGPRIEIPNTVTAGFFSRLDSDTVFSEMIGSKLAEAGEDVADGDVDDLETAIANVLAMARSDNA